MECYSEFEKKAIKEFVSYQGTERVRHFYSYMIDNHFTSENRRALIIGGNEAYLHLFKIDNAMDANKEIKLLIDLFCLLENLEKNGYIYVYGDSYYDGVRQIIYENKYQELDPDKIAEIILQEQGVLLDNETFKKIIYFFYRVVHITPRLIELVKNDFKTQEQIHHEQTMKTARKAICVAIVIGISSVVIGIASIIFGDYLRQYPK